MPSDAFLFLIFAVLQYLDYEMTAGILSRGGRALNPLVRALSARYRNAGLIASKLLAIALGAVLLAYHETAMLAALCVLYVGIIAWNWRQDRR